MYVKMSCIAVSAMAFSSMANGAIIYSDLSETAFPGDSVSVDIAGLNYEFGIQTGETDIAYVTTTSEGAGVFVPLLEETAARNFSAGDSIGTLTSVLKMFPLGGGTENINLAMFDYDTNEGTWTQGETAYVGFGFSSFGFGFDFNYGWIEFTVYDDAMVMSGWAYESEVNKAITVGQIPAPGVLSLLAIAGIASRRRRRG